jgi:hypothetical protein
MTKASAGSAKDFCLDSGRFAHPALHDVLHSSVPICHAIKRALEQVRLSSRRHFPDPRSLPPGVKDDDFRSHTIR